MLDLEHPQTPHIFAASRQLDLILDYCKRISISRTGGRRFMLEVIRPAFAALRWLITARFGAYAEIDSAIAELEHQAEALAGTPLADPDPRAGIPAYCPACGGKLMEPDRYDPIPYCSGCLGVVMPGLQKCRRQFGTDAI